MRIYEGYPASMSNRFAEADGTDDLCFIVPKNTFSMGTPYTIISGHLAEALRWRDGDDLIHHNTKYLVKPRDTIAPFVARASRPSDGDDHAFVEWWVIENVDPKAPNTVAYWRRIDRTDSYRPLIDGIDTPEATT